MNVKSINGTNIISQVINPRGLRPDYEFTYLKENERLFTIKLIERWNKYLRTISGLNESTIGGHTSAVERLLRESKVGPWNLKEAHIIEFIDNRINLKKTNKPISPATQSSYFSGWRSIQTFILNLDVSNEIFKEFNVKPEKFVGDENSLLVKKHKANYKSKAWALTEGQIETIDEIFRNKISAADKKGNQKVYLTCCRDRVMFHLCIHYALRVSELVSVKLTDFSKSQDTRLSIYEQFALLTVTGKNKVTGTIPTRSKDIYALLQWYLTKIRSKILRGKSKIEAGQEIEVENKLRFSLLFPSERKNGGIMCTNNFRKVMKTVGEAAGVGEKNLHPHLLRHTGCTHMVPIYSPEVAQKFMRHKSLATTLHYYHPSVLDAGNAENIELDIFDDDEED